MSETLQKYIESTKREWSPKEWIPSNDQLFTSICDEMPKDWFLKTQELSSQNHFVKKLYKEFTSRNREV